jgi:hypothetical protein
MKSLKRFDREMYKYRPDQMILRLNDMVEVVNGQNVTIEQHSTIPNSKAVIIYGMQPDGTFGIAKWDKEGDNYTNKVVVA